MLLVQRAIRFQIESEEEVGPQLHRLGFTENDVRWVLMTHLHQDHDGGLHYFPKSEIVVSRDEWSAASGFKGRMAGYLNWYWPRWLQPTLVDFAADPEGIFGGRHTLTEAGDVYLISTPGHSVGHLSVVLEEDTHRVFFAGDTSYAQDLLLAGKNDGVSIDSAAARETHARILALAHRVPPVYLPSHDPDALRRLLEREPLLLG